MKLKLLLFILLLNSSLVHAKPEGGDGFDPRISISSSSNENRRLSVYAELNKSVFRPTMLEILAAFNNDLPKIEGPVRAANHEEWAELIKKEFSMAIAKMEMLYPGAIWASLGRDAVQISDLLEAFYLGYGQQNRTARINASGPTFNKAAESSGDYQIIQMLKDVGMDVSNPRMRPFVVLDRTTYSGTSQSTHLMIYIYDYFMRTTGRPAQALFDRVGVLSSQSGMKPARRADFFRELFTQSANSTYPKMIAQIPELTNFTDQVEWHDSFGKLEIYSNGKTGGQLGAPAALHKRHGVLNLMILGYQVVTSEEFKDLVRAKAKTLGYDFDEHMKKYGEAWVPERSSFQVPMYVQAAAQVHNLFTVLFEENPSARFLSQYVITHYVQEVMLRLESIVEKRKLNADEKSEEIEALVTKTVDDLNAALKQELAKYGEGNTAIGTIWLAYLATFTEVDMSYEGKSYLSANAKKIKETFHSIVGSGYQADINNMFLKTLEYALSVNAISSKDYRRLVLNSFNSVPKDQVQAFVRQMPSILLASPKLKDILVRKAEMFITSHRNNFGAQKIYMELVNQNVIPRPNDCDELLLKADEKAKNQNHSNHPKAQKEKKWSSSII